ncbi:MAG: hypothetical protein JO232_18980 [Verrucomicrobia bacterium]|nr:hypothetical protein [Verrucomicrobiota bacterium]
MDPKTKLENCHEDVGADLPSRELDLNQSDVTVENSVDNPVERENDPVSDPDYPGREILLAVADKLLKLFEKR